MPRSVQSLLPDWSFLTLLVGLTASAIHAGDESSVAFDRIVPAWTNYSTAFNATHDTGPIGDYASVASFYTPATDVVPAEYAVIVIGGGTHPPDLSRFQFRVLLWENLDAFIREPRVGTVATWNFAAATGGNPAQPETTTRGGRPAYLLRFSLTNQSIVLPAGQPSVIGFAARGETQFAGELFVPTANHAGVSDVQAGDLVIGGWRYLVDAGGSTIYSGQIAAGLTVTGLAERPRLAIARADAGFQLTWPAAARNFVLEATTALDANAAWNPIEAVPKETNDQRQVFVPARSGPQWFRLRQETPPTP